MASKRSKGSKAKGPKGPVPRAPNKGGKLPADGSRDPQQSTPQDRVTAVRPLWESLTQDQRVQLLTVEVKLLREKARQLTEAARQQAVAEAEVDVGEVQLVDVEPTLEEVLDEGVKRLKERPTWKLWQWPPMAEFYDSESFRQHILEKYMREDLRRLLPREDGKLVEKPAEAAFRSRMTELMQKIQQYNQRAALEEQNSQRGVRRQRVCGDVGHVRDTNIELIAVILDALIKEHDSLYQSMVLPITQYLHDVLHPHQSYNIRDPTEIELSYEELDGLPHEEVARVVEWLTEKVDALGTKLKPEPKDEEEEEEEENMGDVDLWSLADDGNALCVNLKWLQHLQDRLLGEDGHPRKVKAGEDPHKNGLVLEWVYGSIVSTAEKARDGAKRMLGTTPPSAIEAHTILTRALEEQFCWETRAKQCRELLSDLLKSRLEAQEWSKSHNLNFTKKEDGTLSQEDMNLPDEAIVFLLKREIQLTKAKLNFLVYDHLNQQKDFRILKQQLKQGEPEFERLKRELDEVKHAPRGLEGSYRSAAEMERHRHQLADAAIEEQLEVQTAFREQGARLQAIYERKQKTEFELAKRETEIKQLQGWKSTVEGLTEKFQDMILAKSGMLSTNEPEEFSKLSLEENPLDLANSATSLTPAQYLQLSKMRSHFHKDVRKQLYTEADDKVFFDNLKTALKGIEKRLEDGKVAIQHLELHLLNVACDDPGILVGTQLALPILQERLEARAAEFAAEKAKEAAQEVIMMELELEEKEKAERERRKAAKAKKLEKVKTEKERERAERLAKEAEELQKRTEQEAKRREREEEERRQRQEQLEAMRKAEEELIEKRRQELLSDEHGYWRQRMMLEQQAAQLAGAADGLQEFLEAPSATDDWVEQDASGFVTNNRSKRNKKDSQDIQGAAPNSTAGLSRDTRRDRERNNYRDRERHNSASGYRSDRSDRSEVKPAAHSANHTLRASDAANDQSLGTPTLANAAMVSSSSSSSAGSSGTTASDTSSAATATTSPRKSESQAVCDAADTTPPAAAPLTDSVPEPPAAAQRAVHAADSADAHSTAQSSTSHPSSTQEAEAAAQPLTNISTPSPQPVPHSDASSSHGQAIFFGDVPVIPTQVPQPSESATAIPPPPPPAPALHQLPIPVMLAPPGVPPTALHMHALHPSHSPQGGHIRPAPTSQPPASQGPVSPSAQHPTTPQKHQHLGPPQPQQPQTMHPGMPPPHMIPRFPGPLPMHFPMAGPLSPNHHMQQHPPGKMPGSLPMVPPPPHLLPHPGAPAAPMMRPALVPAAVPQPGPGGQVAMRPSMPPGPIPVPMPPGAPGPLVPVGSQQLPSPVISGQPIPGQAPGQNPGQGPNPGGPNSSMPLPPQQPGPMGPGAGMPARPGMMQPFMMPMNPAHPHAVPVPGQFPGAPFPGAPIQMMQPGAPGMPPVPVFVYPHMVPGGQLPPHMMHMMPGAAPLPLPMSGVPPHSAGGPAQKSAGDKVSTLNISAKPFVPATAASNSAGTNSGNAGSVGPANGPKHANFHNRPNRGFQGHPDGMATANGFNRPSFNNQRQQRSKERSARNKALNAQQQAADGTQPPSSADSSEVANGVPAEPAQAPNHVLMPSAQPFYPASFPSATPARDAAATAATAAATASAGPPDTGPPPPHLSQAPADTNAAEQKNGQAAESGASYIPEQPASEPTLVRPGQDVSYSAAQNDPIVTNISPAESSAIVATSDILQPDIVTVQTEGTQPATSVSSSIETPAIPDADTTVPFCSACTATGLAVLSSTVEAAPDGTNTIGASCQDGQQHGSASNNLQVSQHPAPTSPAIANHIEHQSARGLAGSASPSQAPAPTYSSSQTLGPSHLQAATHLQTNQSTALALNACNLSQSHTTSHPATSPSPSPSAPSWSSLLSKKDKPARPTAAANPFPALSLAHTNGHVPQPGIPPVSTHAADSWRNRVQQHSPGAATAQAAAHNNPLSTNSTSEKHTAKQLKGANGWRSSPVESRPAALGSGRGNKPTGAAVLQQPVKTAQGRIEVDSTGRVVAIGTGSSPRPLSLVRGLLNEGSQYNCFLNVILQSLWHLRPVRRAVLNLDLAAVRARAPAPVDLKVLEALSNVFKALSASASTYSTPGSGPAQQCAISPNELREALCALGEQGRAAVRIEQFEMHDAAEVLGEILSCLHRAELGKVTETTQDPELPQKVRVRIPQPPPTLHMSSAASKNSYAAAAAATVAAQLRSASASLPPPSSAVHALFGLDVQVPCREEPEDASNSPTSKLACSRANTNTSSASVSSASMTRRQQLRDAGLVEVQQYRKYFHLVPAQLLREAAKQASTQAAGGMPVTFEDLLLHLEGAGSRPGRSLANGTLSGEEYSSQTALLRLPQVFMLALVWESPQVAADALRGTLEALGSQLDLALLFRLPAALTTASKPPSTTCVLRSVVCYFGHHYQVFAISEELGLWLLYDDTDIQVVGQWEDVARVMLTRRLQPSLLMYQSAEAS